MEPSLVTTLVPQPNPWARISEIAARLGVPPHKTGGPATITATGADGQNYDIMSVVIAALDKIDAVIK